MKNITYYFLLFSLVLHAGPASIDWTKNKNTPTIDMGFIGEADMPPVVTTSLWPSFCNSALPSINTLIGITTVAGPTTRYRIRATTGSLVQVIERPVPHFTMMMFPVYDFVTTYTIEIELQRAGVWTGVYGPACTVTTPQGVTGALIEQQCGITLPLVSSPIATPSLQFVGGYRFRVTNLTDPYGPNAVQVFERQINWFTLQMLARYNYGMTYQVEVALKTFGIFGPYGPPCQISTPESPHLNNCNATILSGSSNVWCPSLPLANQYRFQIARESDYAMSTIDRSSNFFNFNMLPASAFTGGEMYSVRIAVFTAGTWSPFGDYCEIVAPPSAGRPADYADEAAADAKPIKATVYPNPFTSEFTIDLKDANEAAVTLKVYDMLGRLVESKIVTASEGSQISLGSHFPQGVYNIVMGQGDAVKTIRIIKR